MKLLLVHLVLRLSVVRRSFGPPNGSRYLYLEQVKFCINWRDKMCFFCILVNYKALLALGRKINCISNKGNCSVRSMFVEIENLIDLLHRQACKL
jgi:hypothetical protein